MEKTILDAVGGFITKMLTALEKASGKKMGPPRPMKFPYTISAKVVQFPWRFYIEKNWIYKYYFISLVVCLPIFYKLQRLSKTPGNVAKWKELQERDKHHADETHDFEELHTPEETKADDSD